MDPEQRARERIDGLLSLAGWVVQDRKALNLSAGLGMAVRELSFDTGEPGPSRSVAGRSADRQSTLGSA